MGARTRATGYCLSLVPLVCRGSLFNKVGPVVGWMGGGMEGEWGWNGGMEGGMVEWRVYV